MTLPISLIVCQHEGQHRVVLPTKHWITRALVRVPFACSPFVVEFARVGNNTTDYCQVYLSLEPIRHEMRSIMRRFRAHRRA